MPSLLGAWWRGTGGDRHAVGASNPTPPQPNPPPRTRCGAWLVVRRAPFRPCPIRHPVLDTGLGCLIQRRPLQQNSPTLHQMRGDESALALPLPLGCSIWASKAASHARRNPGEASRLRYSFLPNDPRPLGRRTHQAGASQRGEERCLPFASEEGEIGGGVNGGFRVNQDGKRRHWRWLL